MVASLFATILNRKNMAYPMSKEARGRKKLRNHSGVTMINEIMEHVHGLVCSGANISIKHGIDKKATKIIYGRTAAEFKSTIGALPVKSKSAIYISNKFLRLLLYSIVKNISPKSWRQRNPFKAKINE